MVYITDDVMTHVHETLSIYEATESICIVSVLIFTFCVNDMWTWAKSKKRGTEGVIFTLKCPKEELQDIYKSESISLIRIEFMLFRVINSGLFIFFIFYFFPLYVAVKYM